MTDPTQTTSTPIGNDTQPRADSDRVAPGAPPLVVIAGPTGVGKTAAGIWLAKRFDGEVINADSRYLYRGFDIGTAKPTEDEREGVPHHLVDIVPPDGDMSLATYQELALAAIGDVLKRGKLPLLVGGTPLYVNAVVEGWRIPRVPPDPAFRAKLEAEAAQNGGAGIMARLREVDPVAADRCGNNLRRVIRALEVYEKTGVPMSQQEGKGPRPFRTLEIGLTMPRDLLHKKVDARVDEQIERGLVEEVRGLLDSGIRESAAAMSSLGYRQLFPYLRGEQSLDDAIRRLKSDTHRYIRHQETWLRKNPRLIPVDVTRPDWLDCCAAMIEDFLRGSAPAGQEAPADATRADLSQGAGVPGTTDASPLNS